jgi:hypothetical protein
MAKSDPVTIYPKKQDPENLKQMLRSLGKHDGAKNPYRGRSESEIARMLLLGPLKKEYQRICGKK